ncbi:SAV_2336 N-terminal domain-related protein [Streptomyces sp. NPDC015171]|uniref:SAV_2336 N-terminal domain-related protein n=1 Tax=Streptomyces sp. NPDC015171 TaxID=3364945 RepID=UPI0036FA30BE
MPGMRLDELIGKLRQGGLQPTAEEVADALWLARRLGAAPPGDGAQPPGSPAPGAGRGGPGSPPGAERTDAEPGAAVPAGPGTPARPRAQAPAPAVALHTPGGAPPGGSEAAPAAFPVRAPAAGALPGLLGLQKALRLLGRYRTASVHGRDERIDEAATAERAAASGILLPVTRPGRRRRCDVQLLMDTGPAMAVWGRLVEELRQACQQSGAFASVRVHHLYADDSGTPLVGTTAGPGRHTRLRPADELHDPSGRRLTFVISDCVGPLWQNGTAQRLLHGWPRTAPLAVVQPLPPRLWGRTALPAEPGLLIRTGETGGRLDFLPEDEPWEEPPPGARPVPVLQPTPEAFETFARLLAGTGPTREHAWAGLAHPGAVPNGPAAAPPRDDDDVLRAFRASASPGALSLAVYLAAAPLTLPVMQLVQRAMLPDTGPMELAEVLLGGLLRQLPGTEDEPCFAYSPRMQDLLLPSTRTRPAWSSSTARPTWNGTSARAPATSPPWPRPGSPTTPRPPAPGGSPTTTAGPATAAGCGPSCSPASPRACSASTCPTWSPPTRWPRPSGCSPGGSSWPTRRCCAGPGNRPASPRRAPAPGPPPTPVRVPPYGPAWSSAGCCAPRPVRRAHARRGGVPGCCGKPRPNSTPPTRRPPPTAGSGPKRHSNWPPADGRCGC